MYPDGGGRMKRDMDLIRKIMLQIEKEYDSTGIKGFIVKTIYYTFLLENNSLKINKRRRYTDFEWLRKTLCRLYPGIYIPPLPIKSLNVNKPKKYYA